MNKLVILCEKIVRMNGLIYIKLNYLSEKKNWLALGSGVYTRGI